MRTFQQWMSGQKIKVNKVVENEDWSDRVLVIMRGIPGSGKSTAAKKIASELSPPGHVFSTDQFFHQDMDYDKPYVFDARKLGDFHGRNYSRALKAMEAGENVVIDNTNTVARDADNYIREAHRLGYKVMVRESETPWKFDPEILAQKNQHGVPLDKIKMMIQRWVPHDAFVQHFKQKYPGLDIS